MTNAGIDLGPSIGGSAIQHVGWAGVHHVAAAITILATVAAQLVGRVEAD